MDSTCGQFDIYIGHLTLKFDIRCSKFDIECSILDINYFLFSLCFRIFVANHNLTLVTNHTFDVVSQYEIAHPLYPERTFYSLCVRAVNPHFSFIYQFFPESH